MKATDKNFPVALFIMLYKMVLNFESVKEMLKCDYSNESHRAIISYDTACCTVSFLTVNPMDGIL